MIRYSLICDNRHHFDSWFASSSAYDALHAAGQVCCPNCGSTDVTKTLMAPSVATEDRPLAAPAADDPSAQIEKLRKELETNSEDVGLRFAAEARAMHDGDAPARAIHGEAKAEDAKALIEDGVPVLPLPFVPKSKAN